MFCIEAYIAALQGLLQKTFGERLVYLGLQGSYLRGEAGENSDIDIMAVIDRLTPQDLEQYKAALLEAGDYERSCGFLCGKEELAHWNPLEICHLLHTTKDLYGSLRELVPSCTAEDERNFIKLSVGNLYHELCHRYVHAGREKSVKKLPGSCKGTFFILQNLHYIESGEFCGTKAELLERLHGQDKAVLELLLRLQKPGEYDFDSAFALLLGWCQNVLARLPA